MRWALATAAAAAALLILGRFADLNALADAWKRFDPILFALAAALFLANIAARGWRLRTLSAADPDESPARWLRLAALHQAVFTLLPSGTGDLGYPMLAARITGTDPARALRALFIYRLQDLMALIAVGSCGLLLLGAPLANGPLIVALAALAAGAGLLAAPDLARFGLILLGQLLGATRFGHGAIDRWRASALAHVRLLTDGIPVGVRVRSAVATLMSWCAATASLWTLFYMTRMPLGVGEIMLIMAGINLVGALATFTVAGLGVSEGGLAVLLVLLGHPAGEAAAIALTVRPLALVNSLAVCGIAEAIVRFGPFRSVANRKAGETTGARD